jgi:glycosyltransferase involved in cell wall biosynthesis
MDLDIVIPAHNEERRIGPMLDAYRERCEGNRVRFHVALDRCTDGTAEVVRRHARADSRVRIVEHPKLGKGGVIMETFRGCDGDLVGFVDADCATPPGELLRLAEVSCRADGAIASRRHPAAVLPVRRTLVREVASAGFAAGIRRLFGLPYGDTQCGAKVFRRDAIRRMLPLLSSRDFLFDVDVLLVARRLGYRVAEVPTIWIDKEGSRVKPVSDAGRMAASAVRLWLHHQVLPVATVPSDPAEAPERPRARGGVDSNGGGADANGDGASSNGGGVVVPGPWKARGHRPDIAIVSPYPPPGARHAGRSGVASYTANLADSLAAEGASVTVVAPIENGVPTVSFDGPVRVERRYRLGANAMPRAAQAAAELGAGVTHVQHELFLYGGREAMPGLVYGLDRLRRAGGGPVVTMHHVVDSGEVDEAFMELHRVRAPVRLARFGVAALFGAIRTAAERVIVHEPAFASAVPGAVVVPHGLEAIAPEDRDRARSALSLERPLTALCFGFIAPYKGLELALEAADLAGEEVELVVAGGDHPRLAADNDAYADELRERWGGSARFTGRVPGPQVRTWFSGADVALYMYPRPFSSSGSLALALAHGTAPLLSPAMVDATGAPARLAAPTDAAGIGALLAELARTPARLEALRSSARALTRDRSWSAVARRHLEIYEEVSDADRATRGLVRAG